MPQSNDNKPAWKKGTVSEYLGLLKGSPRFGPQVVHHEVIAGRRARYGKLENPLPDELGKALGGLGVNRLYSHQARAIDLIRQGKDVIVATPTASGKSLIYNLPVFSRLLEEPGAKALYLFPLKALAHDQLKVINTIIFETEGLWFEIPVVLRQRLEQDQVHFMGGIHAVEHALIGMFPLLVLCDRNDLGGISYPLHPQLQGSAIFVYDGYPGGVGLARQAFDHMEELLRVTLETIRACPCETGCPSCVHSPKCGSGNRPIDKLAARLVLEGLLAESGDKGIRQPARPPSPAIPLTVRPDKKGAKKNIPVHYTVFDVETQRSAQEVGGWHRAARMGISAAVVYDSLLDEYLVFRENEIDSMVNHLRKCELVVGFNNKRFDNLVLSKYTDFDLASLSTLDILEVVHKQLGYRLSLDRLAEHTLGVQKSADGLQALKWYKEGRLDLIIKYCRHDVQITRDIFRFGLEHGYLLFQNKAGKVVRCPVDFKELPKSPRNSAPG